MKIQVGTWDVTLDQNAGLWLKEYPYGHGTRMSAAGARELAQALLDVADACDEREVDDA